MTQTSNRFFDEAARLMNDAAGVAQGVRREFDTMLRHQAERILGDLDVVKREEFEAVKEMARLAREENEVLKARIAALEAKLEAKAESSRRKPSLPPAPEKARPARVNPSPPRGVRPGFLVFGARHRYTAASLRFQHPWRHAAGEKPFNYGLKHEGLSHGDRQGNQGDGASEGRQGGRPVGASRWQSTRCDLRRFQAPHHHFARLRRPAAEDLCRAGS